MFKTKYKAERDFRCSDVYGNSYDIKIGTKVSIQTLGGENKKLHSFSWSDSKGKYTNILMDWGNNIPKSYFAICKGNESNHPATRIFL